MLFQNLVKFKMQQSIKNTNMLSVSAAQNHYQESGNVGVEAAQWI